MFRSPSEGSSNTVATEGDCLDLPNTAGLLPLGDRPESTLAGPDAFRASDLPLELAGISPDEDRGIEVLKDGDLDEVVGGIPLRGETRAGDRDPTKVPSLGALLRTTLCDWETISTPESLSAVLVSTRPEAGIAKICPTPSPNVAVLEAPLSGTATWSAIVDPNNLTADNL